VRFKRNPKLRLLKSERGEIMGDGYTLFCPVWTPDGACIYYLRCQGVINYYYNLGSLWRIRTDGSEATEVLNDSFHLLRISPDGRRLALLAKAGHLVILKLPEISAESIFTSVHHIVDVRFSRVHSERLYFSSEDSGLYRINIDGNEEVLVDTAVKRYFDLTSSDSVVSGYSSLAVYPSDRYVAITQLAERTGFPQDIILFDTQTRDSTYQRAYPYYFSSEWFPCWSPDGSKLVFTAAEIRTSAHCAPHEGELWVLEDVFQ